MSVIEKRYYARENCNFQAAFVWDDELLLNLKVVNLSPGGLGFEITQDDKLLLLQNGVELNIGTGMKLQFKPSPVSPSPVSNELVSEVSIPLKTRHLRRLSQQVYIAGAEFVDLSEKQQQLVNRLADELS